MLVPPPPSQIKLTYQRIKCVQYRISRNFSEDLIMALLVRLFSSQKFCNANNTFRVDAMCF